MKRDRVDAVLDRLERMGLEQLVITDATSISCPAGTWVDAKGRLVALYLSRHRDCCFFVNNMFNLPPNPGIKIVRFSDMDPYLEMLAGCMDSTRPSGVDRDMSTHFLLPLMSMGYGAEYVNAPICVDGVRAVEDQGEMEAMRRISTINDKATAEFKALLKEGVTEREISNQMEEIYQKLGTDDLSFPSSMCFGTNAAIGYYRSGNVALKKGGCTLPGVGCEEDSYYADMTRTFFCGEIAKKEHRRVYELVLGANRAAEVVVKPGVRLCNIDAATRKVIKDAGYDDRFTHRLGHLIGLEVHDFGDVSGTDQETAVPGNISSIEPGAYLEDGVGVRIEDLVLVTETGYEILNSYGKNLEVIWRGRADRNNDRKVR